MLSLKPGREKAVRNRRPLLFKGAFTGDVNAPPGTEVMVCGSDGHPLARGLADAGDQLAVRLYSFQPDAALDDAWFADAVRAAAERRQPWFPGDGQTTAWRVVHAEGDGLSGLVADRYDDTMVVELHTPALGSRLPGIVEACRSLPGIRRVVVAGGTGGDPAPDNPISFLENGLRFTCDLRDAQKTGFYLDQRENRMKVAALAAGRSVLSAYCYTGAFEVAAATSGAADVLGLDSSEKAIAIAGQHAALNHCEAQVMHETADVPARLRRFRDEGRTFDMIILDPPKFVKHPGQKDRGLRAYKDINLLAVKLLNPGGLLATFSCSGLVSRDDLRMVLSWAAIDAEREVTLHETLTQPPDHPVRPGFPEGEYLCGFIAGVI